MRSLVREHSRLAVLLVALALFAKILIPSGYMPKATDRGIVLELCAGLSPAESPASAHAMHGKTSHHHEQKDSKADSPCAFAGLTAPLLAGADPFLLAGAIRFVMVRGVLAVRAIALPYPRALRPPLRGPPATA